MGAKFVSELGKLWIWWSVRGRTQVWRLWSPSPSPSEQKDSGVSRLLTSPQAQLSRWCNHIEYPGERCPRKKISAAHSKTLSGLWALGQQDSLRQAVCVLPVFCKGAEYNAQSSPEELSPSVAITGTGLGKDWGKYLARECWQGPCLVHSKLAKLL